MMKKIPESQIIIYEASNGNARVEVRFEDENVWLTQRLLAELFSTTTANINIHLKNIFQQNELDENSVIKDFLITASDGKQYKDLYQILTNWQKDYLRKKCNPRC